MDRQELENMGYWERQVACSKLWDGLTTPIYGMKDSKGRTDPQARARKTDWPGCWLFMDGEMFQLLEDEEVQRLVLVQSK